MKPISHLARLWRALACSLRVKSASIPADDFYIRMLAQPVRRFFRRASGQDVDNLTSFQIHHDGFVTLSLPPAPIVDAQHTNVAGSAACAALQLPQKGVVARRHAETIYTNGYAQ
jgi:hypothetical protein